MGPLLFWILSAVAVGSALATIVQRSPLSSALTLTLCLVAVAGLFATLSADFLFVIQLLVYAGAVMVLVIYVIMLLNLGDRELKPLGLSRPRTFVSGLVGILLLALLARAQAGAAGISMGDVPDGFGGVRSIAGTLFTSYLYPFEIVSVLLMAALVGVVVLAMKRF